MDIEDIDVPENMPDELAALPEIVANVEREIGDLQRAQNELEDGLVDAEFMDHTDEPERDLDALTSTSNEKPTPGVTGVPQYEDPKPAPDGPVYPDCTEVANQWTVAFGIDFPWRFKPTSASGGVLTTATKTPTTLPLLDWRGIHKKVADFTAVAPASFTPTITGTGETVLYVEFELTSPSPPTFYLKQSTLAALPEGDADTEIIPIVVIEHTSSVITHWVQLQLGTIRMPANA